LPAFALQTAADVLIVLPVAVWYLAAAYGSIEVSRRGLRLRRAFGLFRAPPHIPLASIVRLVIRGPDFDEDEWCFVGPPETLSAVAADGQSLDLAAGGFAPGVLHSFARELARECSQRRNKDAGPILVWNQVDSQQQNVP
jgi:hypothetical protein